MKLMFQIEKTAGMSGNQGTPRALDPTGSPHGTHKQRALNRL